MAKRKDSLTEGERKELQELIAKKKSNKLSETEAARLDELNKKCGFKSNKKSDFRPGNDFSWWNKLPELMKDAANYKCNYIAGQAIAGSDFPYVIPGVVRITLQSAYGNSSKATDEINVWARDLYLKMFQKYRPASGYAASDLGIALLAANEAVKLIAKYERIYGIINRYSVLNTNMPLVEADALGLSTAQVTYLQSHLSDFRYDLNFLIRKAQRLCIPKDMSVLSDSISLFGYEYMDHDNPRGQFIFFDTDWIGVYDDTTLSSGGAIEFAPLSSGTTMALFDFSADNMCMALSTVLNNLLGSDSIQRIYADLVVWFGAEAMLQFVPIPEDYIVIPAYSESILHKMHNLEMFADAPAVHVSWVDPTLTSADQSTVANGYFWVYQANDVIITKSGVHYNGGGTNTLTTVDGGTILANNGSNVSPCTTNAHIIDTYRVDVTDETVTEGVLFKFHGRMINDPTAGYVTMLDSVGFYYVEKIEVFTNGGTTRNVITVSGNSGVARESAGILAILDWAPLSYNVVVTGSVQSTPQEVYGDVDSVVPIYGNGLQRLQRTIILSGLHTDVSVINK